MPEDLTIKQLKFAQWYLDHKSLLRKSFIGFLVILILIFLGIASYQAVLYFTLEDIQETMLKELTTDRIDFISLHKQFSPHDLIIDKQFLIYDKDLGYDFVAIVENPNAKWQSLSFEYYFSWDNGKTQTKKTFILPQTKKYVFVLGQAITKRPSNIELIISHVEWKRVRQDKQWLLQILPELKISNIKLEYVVPEQKMISLPKISFKVENQSLYSFWQVNFIIALYKGDQLVEINVLPVKNLLANEQRKVELMRPSVPSSTEIQVAPEINIFDPEVFIPMI